MHGVADDDSYMKTKLHHSYTELTEKYPKYVWQRVNGRNMKDVGKLDLNTPES